MNKDEDKPSNGLGYIALSFGLTLILFFIYNSGNISIKGIESNVETEPTAFYATLAVLFTLCLLIFAYGISEFIKSRKRDKGDNST
ncbi:hypothetical protein OE749_13765 [Aestuariibacter sp. AA17]|uniref:DUF3955 domain-containing protein n=1 Tax=Fluctibacter corallii TaxID=2984329 RepID=A0ABT3AAS2_9ALTE|nr:hypothetical protein [Aestuariibacter sp. AA17]MCV2885760.1 hypothetical protein [Aestuariibacter sp. AA17]